MANIIFPEPASKYTAPRDDPLKYPGKRPDWSFVLANGIIHPILYDVQEKGASGSAHAGRVILDENGSENGINDFLKSHGKPPLEERFAVLGYGS